MEEKPTLSTAIDPKPPSSKVEVNHAALYRKIDLHIIPLAFLCYFLNFLDKIVINYAKIMGLEKSLDMHGQDFTWLATALYIAYALAEFPQGVLLQRFSVKKVLGGNVLLWGVFVCASAGTKNFSGMLALRTLLGVVDAVISPALVLIVGQWYTKRQAAPRMGLWYSGSGMAQIIGGLISWAAQHGSTRPGSFQGWRIMMLCVGIFNLIVAVAVLVLLPNKVDDARFLSVEEKEEVKRLLAKDQAGNGVKRFNKAGLLEGLADPAMWLLFLVVVLTVIPSGIITFFSATLIAGFGYDSKTAALLNMPSGVVTMTAVLLGAFAVLWNVPRWLGIFCLMIPAIIGAALMSFASGTKGRALAGIYLINFGVGPLGLVYALVGANVQGYTKRIVANAAVQVAFAIANIIGPQTFQAREAPWYISAKIVVLAVDVAAMVMAVVLRLLYGWRNRRREGKVLVAGEGQMIDAEEEPLTDLKNEGFRYVY